MHISWPKLFALVIALGYLVTVALVERGRIDLLITLGLALVLPLALIWFAEPLGRADDVRFFRGLRIRPSPAGMVAAGGWFFLLGLPLLWLWLR